MGIGKVYGSSNTTHDRLMISVRKLGSTCVERGRSSLADWQEKDIEDVFWGGWNVGCSVDVAIGHFIMGFAAEGGWEATHDRPKFNQMTNETSLVVGSHGEVPRV